VGQFRPKWKTISGVIEFGEITQNKGITPFKVFKVTDFGTNRKPVCDSDFLLVSHHSLHGSAEGGTENAEQENGGPIMSSLRDQNAVLENMGPRNAGPKMQGWKMQDRKTVR